ncbi:MAG: sigma-70 family RNA polymerase sigma factor [Acidobacteriota bacterium]
MPDIEAKEITALLAGLRQGDPVAEKELLTLVYQELRRMAQQQMNGEHAGHTWQATELVHQTYLRLFDGATDFQNRAHFFAIAARQMRRLLVEHARKKAADKRGGDYRQVSLSEARDLGLSSDVDLLALDEVLQQFEKLYPRAHRVVEMRFFAGLSEMETAELLEVSLTTLKRDWNFAKVWLYQRLSATGGLPADHSIL